VLGTTAMKPARDNCTPTARSQLVIPGVPETRRRAPDRLGPDTKRRLVGCPRRLGYQ
jgi:hypothetical protein